MTGFIVVAAALTAIALLVVVIPLLRRRTTTGDAERAATNLAVIRDQVAELDRDLASGAISPEQHAEAKTELERRVLEETAALPGEGAGSGNAGAGRGTVVALALAIPLIAGLFYWQRGNLDAFDPEKFAASASGGEHGLSAQQVEQMIAELVQRLEKNPEDPDGWAILARSYYVMQRFPEAVKAYEQLTRLEPDNADALADYADALAMTQNRDIAGKPFELVKRALAIDPNNWKALAMAGTEAFNRKDYKQAVTYWEKLAAGVPPGTDFGNSIRASIAEARQLAGMPPAPPPSAAAHPPIPAAQAPTSPVQAAQAVAAGPGVTGTVTLSPAMTAKASPEDTVFIFARAAEGPKMPLAIIRGQVKDLPMAFALDDSMAMTPAMKISAFPEIVVGARISKSGSAAPQPGDLEGLSGAVKVGASNVPVVIDKVVP